MCCAKYESIWFLTRNSGSDGINASTYVPGLHSGHESKAIIHLLHSNDDAMDELMFDQDSMERIHSNAFRSDTNIKGTDCFSTYRMCAWQSTIREITNDKAHWLERCAKSKDLVIRHTNQSDWEIVDVTVLIHQYTYLAHILDTSQRTSYIFYIRMTTMKERLQSMQ